MASLHAAADAVTLRFWGVRGSCPAPGPATAGVGGNTSCVTVEASGELLVLDGGTGLRALGEQLLRRGPVDTAILFSHVHRDHIQGIPFFAPIFRSDTRLAMWGAPEHMSLEAVMQRQMGGPTFPVPLDQVPSDLFHHDPTHDDQAIAAIEASAAAVLPGTIAAREGLTIELEARTTGHRRFQRARSAG